MMRLTEQEKQQLLEATQREPEPTQPTSEELVSPEEYFARLAQFRKFLPNPEKPVAFTGDHWRL